MLASSFLCFSLIALVDPIAASDIHRRQISTGPTFLSVPVFSYGYYSQIYPNGEISTSTGTNLQPRGTASGTVTATTSAASDTQAATLSGTAALPSNPLLGPVGTTAEEAFIASVCAPLNSSRQLDMNFPCNKILTYEVACVLGQNYTSALQDSDINQRTSSGDQLKCFCPGGQGADIWQNAQ